MAVATLAQSSGLCGVTRHRATRNVMPIILAMLYFSCTVSAFSLQHTGVTHLGLRVARMSSPVSCSTCSDAKASQMGEAHEDLGASWVAKQAIATFLAGTLILPSSVFAQAYVPSDLSELAPVVKDGKPSPVLLIPVLEAADSLEKVSTQIAAGDMNSWKLALDTLSRKPFTPTKELKRILNGYTDNIYTNDKSRKNMYLDGSAMLGMGKSTFGFGTLAVGGGGAAPQTSETLTYLYRNEALDNVDALCAELQFLMKEREKGAAADTADLVKYLDSAKSSLQKYLSTIPKDEVDTARQYVEMKNTPKK